MFSTALRSVLIESHIGIRFVVNEARSRQLSQHVTPRHNAAHHADGHFGIGNALDPRTCSLSPIGRLEVAFDKERVVIAIRREEKGGEGMTSGLVTAAPRLTTTHKKEARSLALLSHEEAQRCRMRGEEWVGRCGRERFMRGNREPSGGMAQRFCLGPRPFLLGESATPDGQTGGEKQATGDGQEGPKRNDE